MVPIDEFRRLLGDEGATLTDDQLEQLRSEMYAFAEISLSIYDEGRAMRREALRLLPPEASDHFEERSAILEYDAHLERDHAERVTPSRIVPRN